VPPERRRPARVRGRALGDVALKTRKLMRLQIRGMRAMGELTRNRGLTGLADLARVVEADLGQDDAEIIHLELRSERLASHRADRLWARGAGRLVKGDAERRRALEHMEELAKWQINQRPDHGERHEHHGYQ